MTVQLGTARGAVSDNIPTVSLGTSFTSPSAVGLVKDRLLTRAPLNNLFIATDNAGNQQYL